MHETCSFYNTQVWTPNPFVSNSSKSKAFTVKLFMDRRNEYYCDYFDLRFDVSDSEDAFRSGFAKTFFHEWVDFSQPLIPRNVNLSLLFNIDLDSMLSFEDDAELLELAILQQLCFLFGMETSFVRKLIDSTERVGMTYADHREDVSRALFLYAHGLTLRWIKTDPERNWMGYHRSIMLFSHVKYWVSTTREETELIWRMSCALRYSTHEDFQLFSLLESSLLGFARVQYEGSEHGEGATDASSNPPLLMMTASSGDGLPCALCLCSPVRLPVTFGDGSTVCNQCVSLMRKYQADFEVGFDTMGDFENENLEEELKPLGELFGHAFDVTLNKILSFDFKDARGGDESLREIGNKHFRNGKFDSAIDFYSRALEFPGLSRNELAVLYSNRSASFRMVDRLAEATADARLSVVCSQGAWGKAHLRLFESFCPVRNLEEEIAEADYLKCPQRVIPASSSTWYVIQSQENVVEAMCALIRALMAGLPLSTTYRRVLYRDVLPLEKQAISGCSVQEGRQRSLLLQIVHELLYRDKLLTLLKCEIPVPYKEFNFPVVPRSHSDILDCILCTELLCQPVTLPCGHTFCQTCIVRAIDHATTASCCPVCRMDLDPLMQVLHNQSFQKEMECDGDHHFSTGLNEFKVNTLLETFLRHSYATEYQQRYDQIDKQEQSVELIPGEVVIPLIVFPQVLAMGCTEFTVADPGHKLLLRRLAKEILTNSRKNGGEFGACWRLHGSVLPCGVLFKLEQFDTLMRDEDNGGGTPLHVTCSAFHRFQIKSSWSRDGYDVAKIETLSRLTPTYGLPDSRHDWFYSQSSEIQSKLIHDAQEEGWKTTDWIVLFAALFEIKLAMDETDLDALFPPSATWLLYHVVELVQLPDALKYYLMFNQDVSAFFVKQAQFLLRIMGGKKKALTNHDVHLIQMGSLAEWYPELGLAFAGIV